MAACSGFIPVAAKRRLPRFIVKTLTIYKRHPVSNCSVISILVTGKCIRTRLICDRPCASHSFSFRCRCAADNVCLSNQRTIFVQPQVLVIQADFNVTSCQIITTVPLHSCYTVYRIPCHRCSCFQILEQLIQFSLLIDLKSVFVVRHCHITSI